MAELVVGPRIGFVHLCRHALLVIGEVHIDLPRHRIGLHVFGPVHARGAEEGGGEARIDQDFSLAGKPVLGRERIRAVGKRQPSDPPVRPKLGHG
jgi:hypothetical protein